MQTEDRTSPGRCNYCGSTDNAEGFTTREVTHRKRDDYSGKQYVGRTRFTVCASKPCGGNLQMGYEG